MASLKEVNQALGEIGIPVALDVNTAKEVTDKLGRDKFLDAISRSLKGDGKARQWIEINLDRLGLLTSEDGPATPSNDDMPPPQNQDGAKREFLTHHVYGSDALCFEATESRSGFHTIQVDGAKRAGGRRKNWADKITIQITPGEFPHVARLFLGGAGKVEFSAHGPQNDKGFAVERQGDKLYFQMRAKGKPVVGVPVTSADQAHVAALFVRQWLKNYPWLDATAAVLMLKQ